MSDYKQLDSDSDPVTVDSLCADLRALGVQSGQTLLVHSSLSSLGWVCGGAVTVVEALMDVLTEDGTLVMPTHSPGNMEPSRMEHPPVPESWYETIRDQMPPYRPGQTPVQVGAIPECFRSYPGVSRSDHPQHSFAAWGDDAEFVTADHSLSYSLGEQSPLARVYDCDGDVLYLGTDHATSTSLHLAEYRADLGIETKDCGSAILVDGNRNWVTFEEIAFDDGDFPECGEAFERAHPEAVQHGAVGDSESTLVSQPELVDFAVEWFERNRG